MNYSSLFLLLTLVCHSCGGAVADTKASGQQARSDVKPVAGKKVPLADPFILLHNGNYYAYGTGAPDGIAVYVSDDLSGWRRGEGKAAGGLALHKDDVWGGKNFWAPEVYYIRGKFYMYYSAESHICAATSDSPLGPFVQQEKKPMVSGENCIDNTLFRDDDGKYYMYFDRVDDGNTIWVAELEENLLKIRPGTMQKCLHVSQKWERKMGRVVEGCCVVKQNGIYYMTYSANDYRSRDYGIGCATADSPKGPWTKYDHNPLFQKPDGLVGVGHSSMFKDKAGKLRIVFHAHRDGENVHPRCMYISSVRFRYRKGQYMMEIDSDYLSPLLL